LNAGSSSRSFEWNAVPPIAPYLRRGKQSLQRTCSLTSSAFDVVVATRTVTSGPFTNPTDLSGINTVSDEGQAYVLPSDLVLYFQSDRNVGTSLTDLFRASRPNTSQGFTLDTSNVLANVNTPSHEWAPVVTPDELTIYFGSTRTDGGAKGGMDIWRATRASTTVPFSNPTNVAALNTPKSDVPTWISNDGCRLYVANNSGGKYVIEVASKPAM
jgi:hypothetical protein